MSRWNVLIVGDGLRKSSVEKHAKALRKNLGDKIHIEVTDASYPDSRAQRLDAAYALVGDAATQVEELKDELQSWYDNLPENFQQGDKGEALQTAIDQLESIQQSFDDLASNQECVDFPSMI